MRRDASRGAARPGPRWGRLAALQPGLLPALLSALLAAGCTKIRLDPFDRAGGVVLRDLDRDGRLDVAVTMAFYVDGGPRRGELFVYRQDPAATGRFLPPDRYAVRLDPRELAAADLDGDGRLDLCVTSTDGDAVTVLRQDPLAAGRFLAAEVYALDAAPRSPSVGDLDGDGLPDIAVSAFDRGLERRAVALLPQDPAAPGRFGDAVALALADEVLAVRAVDLDGDPFDDLAAATTAAKATAAAGGVVRLLRQDPLQPGSFTELAAVPVGIQPVDVLLADLDGDLLLDVVSADAGPSGDGRDAGLSVALQDGAAPGSWLQPATLDAGVSPRVVRGGDLNGDGVVDLAAYGRAEVTVWFQDPLRPGAFAVGARLAAQSAIGGLDLGDLDGDGLLDVAAGDEGAVVVHLQDPAAPGTFRPPIRLRP